VKAFGWMMSGDVDGFSVADLDQAREWVSA
jgi:hypothetical protein